MRMIFQELQRRAVDGIKRHALTIAAGSPRAEAQVLQEYLWCEESAESDALRQTIGTAGPPAWVTKLLARQLADEERHAALLRERLAALGANADRPAPAIARAKLWWIERACAPYASAFAAGPVVVLLAVAAQLEATGVRMFGRHLGVLEARERAAGAASDRSDRRGRARDPRRREAARQELRRGARAARDPTRSARARRAARADRRDRSRVRRDDRARLLALDHRARAARPRRTR